MAPATSKRRSTRQAIGRKRSLYVDPGTDDDFEADTSDGEGDYQPERVAAPERPQKRRKGAATTKTRRPTTRSKASSTKAAPKKRQTKIIGNARKPRSTAVDKAEAGRFRGPSDGKTPDWTSLPLSILNDIFALASQPLDCDNVAWLHKAAHTCRAFAEPALQTYYQAPLIQHTLHPHHLLELMRIRQGRLFNYNAKVRQLEIDMRRLSYTAHNRALFNLSELVAELPQLQHLEITNPIDVPPYRRMKTQQWYYPIDLFSTLENGDQRLKSWRWSRDMMNEDMDVEIFPYMASVHEGKAFEHLTDLTICGYDVHDSPPTIITDSNSEETTLGLPWALSKLPSLTSLTFVSCDIVRDDFLTALPRNLRHLTLTNCWKLTSADLTTFLQSHGAHLTHLSLNHNVTLNLAFLPVLATSCPRLQHLSVDGHYYSERVSINDAEPEYDQLLDTTSVPTWPPSLRFLELIHLQKWSAEAATNFFRSLASSAPALPDLRVLRLQAHINIPWRDRAGFRDQWIERLQTVYLRRSAPPNPYHGSKKQFALLQQTLAAQAERKGRVSGKVDEDEDELAALVHPRALSHVAPSLHKPSGDTDAYDSEVQGTPPVTRRRSTRVAASHSANNTSGSDPNHSSSDEDAPTTAAMAEEDVEELEPFVQGLCTLVDVRIDNQRPRENLFTENDFLDSEVSGDEDWDEGADMEFEEGGYAW